MVARQTTRWGWERLEAPRAPAAGAAAGLASAHPLIHVLVVCMVRWYASAARQAGDVEKSKPCRSLGVLCVSAASQAMRSNAQTAMIVRGRRLTGLPCCASGEGRRHRQAPKHWMALWPFSTSLHLAHKPP